MTAFGRGVLTTQCRKVADLSLMATAKFDPLQTLRLAQTGRWNRRELTLAFRKLNQYSHPERAQ
jgi:hypothetical protein